MANRDNPKGLWPLYSLTGGEMRTRKYTLTTGQTVYKGDLLKVIAGGTVEEADANDGIIVIGVAAEYVDGTVAGTEVLVYDDPYIVFGVQCDTGTVPLVSQIHATANHVAGAGSSVTKLSGHELDTSDLGTGGQLKVVGLVEEPDNAWLEHAFVAVLIAEHFYNAAVAGVST